MKTKASFFLILILLGIVGYGLYHSIEFYDEKTDKYWSAKALRNPLLAAEQFLRLRGETVQSSNRLKLLDDLSGMDAIFISDSRHLTHQIRVDSIIDWMRNGGRLIVGASNNNENDTDLLLSHFNVKKTKVDCECESDSENNKQNNEVTKFSDLLRKANEEFRKTDKQKAASQTEVKPDTNSEAKLTNLYFDSIEGPVNVQFATDFALQHPVFNTETANNYQGPSPFYWESNQAGVQFLQVAVGDGLLTVLSDSHIWGSRSIGEADHAYLLAILMGTDQAKSVLLMYGTQMASIFSMLIDNAPEFVFASIVLLLCWLFYKIGRFGPIKLENSTFRRSLEEHIKACNELLWRSKKDAVIIENLHSAIFRKIRRTHLGFDSLDKTEKIEWISSKCGLPAKDVEYALYPGEINSEEHFQQVVSLTQKIGITL